MHKTHLMAIQEDGQKLVMMDGTIWVINPDDTKSTSKWIPPCGILIDVLNLKFEYDYSLTNTDENVTVTGQKRR